MSIGQVAGVLPAIIFPAATALQLIRILRAGSAAGVSAATWSLFGVANIALYVYAERYTEWQSIVGMLLTAVIDFAIAGLAIAAARGWPLAPATGKPVDGPGSPGACSNEGISQPRAHEREEEIAGR